MNKTISRLQLIETECDLYEELVFRLREQFPGWDITDDESFQFSENMANLVHKVANKHITPYERTRNYVSQVIWNVKRRFKK